MKHLICIVILFGVVLGCKPKANSEKATEKAEDSTEVQMSAHDAMSQEQQAYFAATGTEPFWSIELFDNHMVYKTPTDSIKTPHAEPVNAADAM